MEKKSKHRPLDSLKYVKFACKNVAFYIGLTNEEIGVRVRDLITNMFCNGESKYPENQAAIKEAQSYWDNKNKKIEEWKQKKKEVGEKPPEKLLTEAEIQELVGDIDSSVIKTLKKYLRQNEVKFRVDVRDSVIATLVDDEILKVEDSSEADSGFLVCSVNYRKQLCEHFGIGQGRLKNQQATKHKK